MNPRISLISFQMCIYFVLYVCVSFQSFAQLSVHQVLAVSAAHVDTQELSVYWTIGEPLNIKHEEQGIGVYEGFQQGAYAYGNTIGDRSSPTALVSDEIRYYPNPVETNLHVDDKHLAVHTLALYNDAGGHIFTYTRADHAPVISIDMGHLPTGLYFVRLIGSDNFLIKNFRIYKR